MISRRSLLAGGAAAMAAAAAPRYHARRRAGGDGQDRLHRLASGVFSDIGAIHKVGAELALADMNAKSGRVKFEFAYADDTSKPAVADTEARRLVGQENVDVLFGLTSSANGLVMTSLCNELGVFMLELGPQDSSITGAKAGKPRLPLLAQQPHGAAHAGHARARAGQEVVLHPSRLRVRQGRLHRAVGDSGARRRHRDRPRRRQARHERLLVEPDQGAQQRRRRADAGQQRARRRQRVQAVRRFRPGQEDEAGRDQPGRLLLQGRQARLDRRDDIPGGLEPVRAATPRAGSPPA